MKKLKTYFAGILAGILLFSSAGTAMAEPAAKTKNPSMMTLETNRTYQQFDITGDGKADRISFKLKPTYSGLVPRQGYLKVYVNEKTALTLKDRYYQGDYTGKYDVKLCTVNPEDIFLFVRAISCTDHCNFARLYRYKNGKLQQMLDLKKIYKKIFLYRESMDVKEVTDRGIVFRWYGQAGAVGALNWTTTMAWNGYKFYRPSKICRVTEEDRNRSWTAERTFSVYRTAALKTKVFFVKAGDKVKITHVYNNSKRLFVRVVNKKGQAGWVPCPNEYSKYFKEAVYVG